MSENNAIVIFNIVDRDFSVDIDIPLQISANDLVIALNEAYDLGINTSNVQECYMACERPVALLKGNKTLSDFGVRNGSVIYFKR